MTNKFVLNFIKPNKTKAVCLFPYKALLFEIFETIALIYLLNSLANV